MGLVLSLFQRMASFLSMVSFITVPSLTWMAMPLSPAPRYLVGSTLKWLNMALMVFWCFSDAGVSFGPKS